MEKATKQDMELSPGYASDLLAKGHNSTVATT